MDNATALRLACAGPEPRISKSAARALEACRDRDGLVRLATAHKVAPWLAAALATPAGQALGEFPGLAAAAGAQTLQALRLFSELSNVVRQLNEANIAVVVLKGPVLGQTVYPDAGLRPYGDVDILIHERDLVAVSRMLVARGYMEKNGAHDDEADRFHDCHGVFQRIFINQTTGMIVEVHCDHLQIGLEPVGMDEIWESSQPVRVGRGEARALDDHDLFVQLCVHLQRHGYERLIWFKDLDLIVRRDGLDWARVGLKADEQGCLAAVSYTLWMLPRVLGTPLPDGARALSSRQGGLSRALYRRMWPVARVRALEQQRQWRFRRLVQFAPETGLVRGGLPSFLTAGRRQDKVKVLWAGLRR